MSNNIIFCPNCDALILDAARCPACGKWERPPVLPAERGALAWRATLPAGLASCLTLADGVLYACDAEGKLHALDAATGKPRWQQPVDLGEWRVYRQIAVAGDLVLVGPTDSRSIPQADKAVLALEAASGAVHWRTPLAARLVSDPVVAGDAVYVATSDGHAVSLALADGALRWRVPIQSTCLAAPAPAGRLVVFGGDKGVLTALAAADGSEVWSFQAEPDPQWGAGLPYPPVCVEGRIYATCWNRRCYALDAGTGAAIWAGEPTKRPPLTPPALHEGKVYLCGHDRYVYCLDAADGATCWRTQLPRRSITTPVVIEGQAYVVSQDHMVYALNAATGDLSADRLLETERHVEADWAADGRQAYLGDVEGHLYAVILAAPLPEAAPETLAGQGKWPQAAVRYALTGNLRRAAEIYARELAEPRHAARLYERAGEKALAAEQFERGEALQLARAYYSDVGRHDDAARVSLALGDQHAAAQALEAAGRAGEAAELYAQLLLWPQAAALYERAAEAAAHEGDAARSRDGRLAAADIYYKQLRQPDKAMQLYREAGAADKINFVFTHERDYNFWRAAANLMAPERAAAAYAERGYFIQAGEAYGRAGRPAEAAAMYERAGEYAHAKDWYLQAKQPAEAARVMALAGNLPEAASLYEQAGDLAQAAALYAQAGNHARAAAVFEELRDWTGAANQWSALPRWEQAAAAWEKADDFEQAASAYLRLGACFKAADCLWRAAQKAQTGAEAPETTAALYDRALAHYADCGADDRAAECDRLRRWLRKQPLLDVPPPQVTEFLAGDYGRIEVVVHNIGWGMAREVALDVSGQFEADRTRANKAFGLESGLSKHQTLWVAPKRSGKQLPLHLQITYLDARGNAMPPLEVSYEVSVRDKAERRGDSTPIIVQEGGKIIQMGAGDYVEGDQAKISRQGAGTPPQVSVAAAPELTPAPRLTCPACGTEQPADHARCRNDKCGMPFIRCASCGCYQPARAKFCMHCQAAQ